MGSKDYNFHSTYSIHTNKGKIGRFFIAKLILPLKPQKMEFLTFDFQQIM